MKTVLAFEALVLLGFIAVMMAGCSHAQTPSPATPGPSPSDASCALGCENVQKLGCRFSESCMENCTNIDDDVYKICLETAGSCQAVDGCDKPK